MYAKNCASFDTFKIRPRTRYRPMRDRLRPYHVGALFSKPPNPRADSPGRKTLAGNRQHARGGQGYIRLALPWTTLRNERVGMRRFFANNRQSRRAKQLTKLATVAAPLSVVSAVFSMGGDFDTWRAETLQGLLGHHPVSGCSFGPSFRSKYLSTGNEPG